MNYLLWGLGVLIALYLIRRFLGDHQQAKSHQYGIFEKRFQLQRKTFRSQWGKGMGSHFSLEGHYRGYPVRLYSHFHSEGREKQSWTSLTFETLFSGELEFVINAEKGDRRSCFAKGDSMAFAANLNFEGFAFSSNDESFWATVWSEELGERLGKLVENEEGGSVCLSKGFLEYRESGEMDSEEKRIRYQNAILFLADLADSLSAFCKEK